MHAIRSLLAATSAILAFAVLAPPASQAAETRSLTVTKQCLGPAGPPALLPGELEYCTIAASNFSRLIGAKIRYFGPGFVTEDHLYLDSRVLIEGTGGTAFGHCLVRIVSAVAPPAGVLGACQFTGGSGSLRGFKADVTVTTVDFTTWNWNGTRVE